MKVIFALGLLVLSQSCFAYNTWYWGKATQIIAYGSDGSFMVTIDNPTINSICSAQRVNYLVTDLGEKRVQLALNLALSALHSGKEFGTVLDIPAEANSVCAVPASTGHGAGIR